MEKLIKISKDLKTVTDRYEFLQNERDKLSNGEIIDDKYYDKIEKKREILYGEIKILLKKTLKLSNKYVYYFTDCSKETYFKTLSKRFVEYKKKHSSDLPELYDFIIEEIKYFKNKDLRHTIKVENCIVDYTNVHKLIFDFDVFMRQKLEILLSYERRLEDSKNEFYIDDNGLLVEISRSEQLVKDICKKIQEHRDLKENYEEIEDAIHNDDFNNEEYLITKQEIENLEWEIKELLDELYSQSQEDFYNYPDCTFKIFERHFQDEINTFKTNYPDADVLVLLKSKIHYFKNISRYRYFFNDGIRYDYDSFLLRDLKYKSSNDKKINYLKDKIESYGFKAIFEDEKNNIVVKLVDKKTIIENKQVGFENEKPIISKEKSNDIKGNTNKIKWTAGPSTLGYILSHLNSLGYIETPQKNNGETNYSALARQVLQTFDINSTEDTLKKYLNLDSEKSQQIGAKFEKQGFNIPHSKAIGE